MLNVSAVIDGTFLELDRLKKTLRRRTSRQVTSIDEISLVRATSLAWFNNHRSVVLAVVGDEALELIDNQYKLLISASDKASARTTYLSTIKNLRRDVSQLRTLSVSESAVTAPLATSDTPPDFSPIIQDARMKSILEDRWKECSACLRAGAPLSATVMMGGLLEAFLLARINAEPNKDRVFKAKAAPVSHKTKKTLPLSEWTLRHYLDVAHELRWISRSAKDIGAVLRDYRNYIHPHKELSHGITLHEKDAALFWEISKSVSKQLIEHAK